MNKEFSIHWLEDILDEISSRNPEQITLATGKTPSGHVHLGILREILICEALRKKFKERGKKVQFYLFLDDFDAAKRFPDYIDKQFQEENLGKPFALIPCPEKDCGCENCDCNKEMRVYFCPKCESTKVKYVFELGNLFGVMPKQRCQKCGLELNGFPLLVTTKRAFRDAAKGKKRVKKGRKKVRKVSKKKVRRSKK